jgi:hypothetical protein
MIFSSSSLTSSQRTRQHNKPRIFGIGRNNNNIFPSIPSSSLLSVRGGGGSDDDDDDNDHDNDDAEDGNILYVSFRLRGGGRR